MLAEAKSPDRLFENSGSPREVESADLDGLQKLIASATEPLVLRGLVRDWPLVQAGLSSPQDVGNYLSSFYSGRPLIASSADATIEGRIGYNSDLSGFNFERENIELEPFLLRLYEQMGQSQPRTNYVGSTLIDSYFPGLRAENDLALPGADPLVSIWMGNQVTVPAHFDFPDNIACCVVGRRRFTVFPPDQLENLYIGPWDLTPAGQAVSLVNFKSPDFTRFPRFAEAIDTALEVLLEPGDALFLPSMWWHHVEGLDSVNMLVNYWWRSTPNYMGTPMNVFKHALLSIKGLPEEQRKAWKNIFNHYIFDQADDKLDHIPESAQGMLSDSGELMSRRLRADLLNSLNR
jgi:Cupin-like domain